MTGPHQPISQFVYKICTYLEWQRAREAGQFNGATVDINDGFIHFSTADQMKETAEKHFKGQKDLKLLQINIIGLNIIWEVSRGGQFFPHLYDMLPLSAVVNVWDLPLNKQGEHLFPEVD